MSDLDERLARALEEEVPQPPRELDPESLRTAVPPRRRRALGPALAAAAMIIVAVTIGALAGGNGPRHPSARSGAGHQPGRSGQPSPSTGPDETPWMVTEQAVARLLAAAPTMPGAEPADHPPVKALRQPMESPASPNLIRRTRWWTVPGTMGDASAYFGAHPPTGMTQNGSSTAGGPSGVTAQEVTFGPKGRMWLRPTVYTELELLVAVAPFDGGVAIRVDAEAIWMPQRTAAEQIPDDVTSVDVVVDRTGRAPTVRRTLDANDARSLAAAVNGLPVYPPFAFHGCPMDRGYTDTLTFHGPSGDVTVNADVGGCAFVRVGPRSADNPTLGGGSTVDQAVLRALGLPHNYGQR